MALENPSPLGLLAPVPGSARRRAVNRAVEIACTLAAVLAVAVLLLVVISVFIKGAPAISWKFLTSNPQTSTLNFGVNSGGIANSIVGSAILIGLASAMAVPVGILVAIYTSEFAGPRSSSGIRFALDVLNGVPTIVTGVFVYGVLVVGAHQSGWAGAIALAIVELPIVARSSQEVLVLVPRTLHEAGLALGLKRWRVVVSIVLPTALGGLITGAVLGVARVAGETAPLIFTSSIFSNLGLTTNPAQAMPNIPVTLFSLSESASPQDHAQAWASALVLIAFVLILSILARAFHARSMAKLSH
ncbi:MAG TPA: phosphate ABC transporter permease PstA [Solirubrobacteraceae bacterium]|nr:phosphate ABC transporter permease PstA [Solirubrobacteraceae bacterium]